MGGEGGAQSRQLPVSLLQKGSVWPDSAYFAFAVFPLEVGEVSNATGSA